MRKKLSPEQRKQQIIQASLKLFREKGYEQTTVSNIIDEAGISKGGFYHHYDSKEQLLEDIAQMFIERSFFIIQKISERSDLSALEKTNKYMWEINSIKKENPLEVYALISEMYSGGKNKRLENLIFDYSQEHIAPLMQEIIEQGIEEGEFKTDYPEEAAEVFVRLFIIHQRKVAEAFSRIVKEKKREKFEAELKRIKRKYSFLREMLESLLGLEKGDLDIEQIAEETLEYLVDILIRGEEGV